jgi:hypothetical protein
MTDSFCQRFGRAYVRQATSRSTYGVLYPLSVERHVQGTIDRLVPGITTVTVNAGYHALHGRRAGKPVTARHPIAVNVGRSGDCPASLGR